ncbi:GntR family transcriptional regulator [Schlesneria paludicola]|uniref:GntR family transcriptional regulator n=1 Tax=Schlesneria paludicola TaxID=360056 RepID=UPI00029A0E0C|nr:GntR family transcriptional regulator [Schlesneria paludicola]
MSDLLTADSLSKSRQAFLELRERILDGRLPPGTHLTLRPIAKSLGVTVTAVSEAVRELVHEQLVDFEPNYGARVKRFDAETVRSQHVLRIAIECEAIRRCTQLVANRKLDELQSLAEEVDRLADVEENLAEARRRDFEFHLQIAEHSGVPSLAAVLRSCHLVRLLAVDAVHDEAMSAPNRTHVELVAAIRSRDVDIAEKAMRDHCERSLLLQLRRTFGTIGI